MTLRETLKNNPYGNYIIAVIEGLNTPNGRIANPFEALVIGYLLKYRSLTWNEGAFDLSASSRAGVERESNRGIRKNVKPAALKDIPSF